MPPRASRSLVARMREAWPPFRRVTASLRPETMEAATTAGWTYKEMLAHVAAWHDLTARRFAFYRATGLTEPPDGSEAAGVFDALGLRPDAKARLLRRWDTDDFNAAVGEVARSRPAADVLRDLDESFERLVAQVAALSDEQVHAHVSEGRSWVEAVLAGNSFGHYAEHEAELRRGAEG